MSAPQRMHEKAILRVVAAGLAPFIVLFALYVQFHGDFGPGGGFQAGVIFGAGFILHGLIFGLDDVMRVAPPKMIEIALALGLLLYAGTGVACMVAGGNFLDYTALDSHDAKHGLHLGLLLIEGGVGITVTAAMTTIFYLFAGRARA